MTRYSGLNQERMHWLAMHGLAREGCSLSRGTRRETMSTCAILKSHKNVKGIVISTNAEFAETAEKKRYEGIIESWCSPVANRSELMVRWEGYQRNQKVPLWRSGEDERRQVDSSGASLDLKLYAYKDGRDAPELQNEPAPAAAAAAPAARRR